MAEGTAHYHLISRASNRQFLFRKVRTKDKLVELVRKAAEFSGIELEACAIMDNHIHVLCTVVRTGDKVPEAEVVRRVREVFSGCLPVGELTKRVAQLGEGKIYGSEEFVRRWIVGLGSKFNAAHVAARAVGEIGFSSHGWRIAGRAEKAACVA